MDIALALRALANARRLQILEWLKEAVTHFPPQVDGDLERDGVCAALIAQKRKAEVLRDSLIIELTAIRSIDAERYVWGHIFEEISRALPDYTWLTGVEPLAAQKAPSGPPAGGAAAAAADTGSVAGGVNRLYTEYFRPDRLPARTTVGVTHLARGGIVEVDMIARRS